MPKKKLKLKKFGKKCENCSHCIYILEGDFYCDENEKVVLTDFTTPTQHYMICKGYRWVKE